MLVINCLTDIGVLFIGASPLTTSIVPSYLIANPHKNIWRDPRKA